VHGSSYSRADERAAIVTRTIAALHQTFGQAQAMMQLHQRRTDSANTKIRMHVEVIVCTTRDHHLADRIQTPRYFFEHQVCDIDPRLLGFACHDALKAKSADYDWYGFMEDDLLVNDPMFFGKLDWFQQLAGDDAVLQPNRFERSTFDLATKAYVDGDLDASVTQDFQDVTQHREIETLLFDAPIRFIRATNPHSGCFFLNRQQLMKWIDSPAFLDRRPLFIGPLESAASLSLMRTFRVYKPAVENAGFLEIEHQSMQFISQLRSPNGSDNA
jgi:hypothetical protein